MIGSGYASCKACHYDSSGGGPLTDYGRTIAEEHLSTWSRAKEGEAFYGLFSLNPLGVAGDFRTLFQRYEDDQVRLTQSFPMQREVSLTFDPSKNVSFVGSAGLYGPDAKDVEYRRYYGKVALKSLGLRAGRFLPAFGLNIPDHTKGIKELFSQGKESLNFEVSLTTKYVELFATRIAGSNSGVVTGNRPTVIQRDDRNGYAYRATLNPKKGLQFGVSYASLTDDETIVRNFVSYHAFIGSDRVWLYGEHQSWPERDFKTYGNLGIAFVRGFWFSMEADAAHGRKTELFSTFRFFPRPHHEYLLSFSKKEFIAVSHYYL